jgi:2-polyprenyl-3-methyl-5-hydroxy-6-metoxy-1,4-benzoquinol methylase
MNVDISEKLQILIDEQFCQAFELESLVNLLIKKESERWIPGFSDLIVEKEHTFRYKWVSNFVKDMRVLDIACGTGKGSILLATEGNASDVTGCDLDSNAIKYASIRNKHSRVSYINQDAQKYEDRNKYDAIVSFETIEHLPNYEEFLKSMTGLLSPKGCFYISTPISKKNFDKHPDNPYHLQEWGFNEFQYLISKYFIIKDIYLQLRNENCSLILFRLKKKLFSLLESDQIRTIKTKFLGEGKIMQPVKFEDTDNKLFKNDYGIVGYQILVLNGKNDV